MKKRSIAVALLCVMLAVVFALCGCNNVQENRGRKINSINHRGYGDAPENTLSAYRMSKEKGFTMVECDICFTKDGKPVLLHDDTVNRTSNIEGKDKVKISELTLEEARELDFGSWKDSKYAGEKIPTYEEFIDLCLELELYPYIELKNGATEEQVAYLAKVIDDLKIEEVTWIARDINFLKQLSNLRPNDRLGLVVNIISTGDVKAMAEIDNGRNVCFMDVFYSLLTLPQISTCKKYNVALEVWTLDTEKKIAKAAAALTAAFAEADVPKVNVITGKAFGSAYVTMNSKGLGADMVYAWPNAQIGMMDAKLAVKVMYPEADAKELREKAAAYAELQNSVASAAKRGYVDTVIDAQDTRKYVIGAFEMLFTKREDRPGKKHGTV